MVRILIREGQDMNEQTQHLKSSPLHIAAKHGHYLIVKYLLEIGASANITNRDGRVAFDLAEDSKRTIELSLASSKNKVGGPGFDLKKAQDTVKKLDEIKRDLSHSL
jgi:ankyrin repeat protein